MQWINQWFGHGDHLTAMQMSLRGICIFFVAFLLIRVSGRRSFGLHMPLDNIITITLGAVLSRAVVGVSPFLPIVAACTVIVLLHRAIAWMMVRSSRFSRFIEGRKRKVFEQGQFLEGNMSAAQVCREDVMQGVRKSALTENLEEISTIYIERNGEVSALKKENR